VANPQVLTVPIPDNDTFVPVPRRTTDDLPAHVKGSAEFHTQGGLNAGYYIPAQGLAVAPEPVEFLNNSWYGLVANACRTEYRTCSGLRILPENIFGLGYWYTTDPQHPNYQAPIAMDAPSRSTSRNTFRAPQTSDSSSGTSTISAHTAHDIETIHEPNSPAVTQPPPTIASITTPFEPTDPPIDPDTIMSVNATTTTPNPPNGGMKGIAPAVFTGDRSRSDAFWNEFCHYRLLNRNNESIKVPFFRVLTALSYIKGPLVEDWVNTRDEELEKRVDTTRLTSVGEDDEVLWEEFEAHFKSAWKDTAKTQNVYDQLMQLTMQGYDIDTYNATFERLASAAEWEPDAKGTIARYRSSLRHNVYRKILERENWPTDMSGWMTAARKEVNRVKEIENTGLNQFRGNQVSRDTSSYHTGQRSNTAPRTNNNQHVPMDVDATNATLPFKKLMDEERTQYRAEGRCFRCHTQGHMARNCLKNSNSFNRTNANVHESANTTVATTSTAPAPPVPANPVAPPVPPKLSFAQQIRALENRMTEEERGAYLDARDMGEDFCSARL
jgi:hypothetical protein